MYYTKAISQLEKILNEVSLAFDLENGVLHKHGDPQMVSNLTEKAKKKLTDGGFQKWQKILLLLLVDFQ